MPDTLKDIQELIRNDDVVVSNHGYDELAKDLLTTREILAGVAEAIVVEEYPIYPKGPCVLVCSEMPMGNPFMLFGGFPKATVLRLC